MIDICLADFRAFYGEHMMNRTHPYEGIVSALETPQGERRDGRCAVE